MPIAELAPAPYNPRMDMKPGDREYESLRRSIEEFGVVDPVIFNTRTKRLVGGHQRLTVLRDLGHASAPTVLVDLDELREKALNLALNKITGEWDMPLLKNLLLDIERSGGDQSLTGFDPKEIEEIITNYRDDDPGEDIPVPEPPADPVTRLGDLYELGPHRLLCGDARDGGAWELLMGQDRADCMWTDPPYGVDLHVGGHSGDFAQRLCQRRKGPPAFRGDAFGELEPLLGAAFPHAFQHLKPGAPIYVAAPHSPDQFAVFVRSAQAAGWHRTSKWNKIEHRMFSFISLNWRGRPLVSYETVVNLIASTRTQSGLRIKAVLDERDYETKRHRTHPDWNYTIAPRRASG